MFKKIILIALSLIMSLSLCVGCGTTGGGGSGGGGGGDVTPPVESRDPSAPVFANGRIVEPKKHIMDSFNFGVGGFTESNFYINQNRWGDPAVSNGVIGENVGYTADGIAVLKAYGDLVDDPTLKRAGSCLLSHEYVGPGLIEVAMKVMPRLGGCTAIWPYFNGFSEETGEYQYQEIDIEIPAGADDAKGVKATFENVMNTNYEINYKDVGGGKVYTTKNETLTPTNDGKWHKYSIKWETMPTPRVRYYMDGVLTADTNDKEDGELTVSTATAPLQIGVWFPNGWAGDRNFEEAFALVDWVSYMPFTEQPCSASLQPSTISGLYPDVKYPKKPMEIPELNYISNGTFENVSTVDKEGKPKMAWGGDFASNMLQASGSGHVLALASGKKITQDITGVYGKTRTNDPKFGDTSYYYEYLLTGSSVVSGVGEATVKVEFLDNKNAVIPSGTKSVVVNSTKNFELKVKSVNGSKAMRVTISTASGTVSFDNLKMKML